MNENLTLLVLNATFPTTIESFSVFIISVHSYSFELNSMKKSPAASNVSFSAITSNSTSDALTLFTFNRTLG